MREAGALAGRGGDGGDVAGVPPVGGDREGARGRGHLELVAGVQVLVRPGGEAAALDAADLPYRRTDEGLAVDATPEQVGELAGQHGIVLHGLVGTADLEQAFFRLINETGPVERPAAEEVRS